MKNSLTACRRWTVFLVPAALAWIGFVLWWRAGAERSTAETAILALGVPLLAAAAIYILCKLRPVAPPDVTATHHPDGGPARILLMRHAEKTGDPDDIHLSKSGKKRADRLAAYIPDTFGKPDFIFAAARSRRSIRSIETMQPLGAAIGVDVHRDIEDTDFGTLVREIFSNPIYRGKTIAVCWHHGKLPEIAALLGAPRGSYPDPWPQDTFNLIVDVRYDPRSDAPPKVKEVIEPF